MRTYKFKLVTLCGCSREISQECEEPPWEIQVPCRISPLDLLAKPSDLGPDDYKTRKFTFDRTEQDCYIYTEVDKDAEPSSIGLMLPGRKLRIERKQLETRIFNDPSAGTEAWIQWRTLVDNKVWQLDSRLQMAPPRMYEKFETMGVRAENGLIAFGWMEGYR